MQSDLFDSTPRESVHLGQGAWLDYHPAWLARPESDTLLSQLECSCPWQQPSIVIAGRRLPIPRLQCWYGDTDAVLRYSGQRFEPLPWLAELQAMRDALEKECATTFNSVLVNLYRDGNDSVSWHADDETELGENPVIASVSLGASRKFSLKPKKKASTTTRQDLVLQHGDLLVMRGTTQRNWHHALPKTLQPVTSRINLTFRWMRPQG